MSSKPKMTTYVTAETWDPEKLSLGDPRNTNSEYSYTRTPLLYKYSPNEEPEKFIFQTTLMYAKLIYHTDYETKREIQGFKTAITSRNPESRVPIADEAKFENVINELEERIRELGKAKWLSMRVNKKKEMPEDSISINKSTKGGVQLYPKCYFINKNQDKKNAKKISKKKKSLPHGGFSLSTKFRQVKKGPDGRNIFEDIPNPEDCLLDKNLECIINLKFDYIFSNATLTSLIIKTNEVFIYDEVSTDSNTDPDSLPIARENPNLSIKAKDSDSEHEDSDNEKSQRKNATPADPDSESSSDDEL